ncbi:hypothetical protein ADL15_44600 [Actinoplanes awajinensis subsp. mycoplanecinus]|uniref:DUF4190 domain-containing protein n=2 Tax=Actinoplanes awajinensis TaxID=135946 RepID=A0A124G7Y1_9ACTN|nr:hypothetical protein ADL15_44600 [Actinoplanes awajinensis subsp. mycoplanecinus]
MALSGVFSFLGAAAFVFAGDGCADHDTRFICTTFGLNFVAAGPFWAGVAGVVIALASSLAKPGARGLGIAVGYAVSIAGFLICWMIAVAG